MKSFKKYLEGRDDYNNYGVPYYASSDHPSPEPDYYPADEKRHQEKIRSQANIKRFANATGKKFTVLPNSFFAQKYGDGATGVINLVGGTNFSYSIDGIPDKKFTYSITSMPHVLELIE
jgi:hypothetical protein